MVQYGGGIYPARVEVVWLQVVQLRHGQQHEPDPGEAGGLSRGLRKISGV